MDEKPFKMNKEKEIEYIKKQTTRRLLECL